MQLVLHGQCSGVGFDHGQAGCSFSVGAFKAKLGTQFTDRVAARAWATPGVCKFLEQYQRRAVRAHAALTAMSKMGSQHGSGRDGGELFPPTEGEHDVHSADSDSDSTLSQAHSEGLYA